MSFPRYTGLLVALLPLWCTRQLPAQAAATPESQQMSGLLQAEQSALDAGDTAAILAAGRELAGFASRLLGDLYNAENRPAQATAAYQQSITLAPNAGTWMRIASARHSAEDLTGTIAALSSAVSLAAEAGTVHLALGSAYWELNEYGYNMDTLREFREAQRLSPGDYTSNYDLGVILSQYQKYAEAAIYLTAAVAADPATPDAWVQLGMNSYAQQQFTNAETQLGKAVQLTGRDIARNHYQLRKVYAVLSRIMAASDRDKESAQYTALAEEVHREMARNNVGASPSENSGMLTSVAVPGQPEAAPPEKQSPPTEMQQQLEAQLKSILVKSLNDAGTSLARNRDYAAALPFFEQAASADPGFAPAVRNLGLAAFHTSNYAEAAKALARTVEQNPEDTVASNYLQQSRAQLQDSPGRMTHREGGTIQ